MSSDAPSSSSPSLPRAFPDISLVSSSLEPAITAARRSSDNLFELVKNEREKVAKSIRSAAAAAAASPFAPVSLDDFGGEAWRNATTSGLAFFGGVVEQQQQATRKKREQKAASKSTTNARSMKNRSAASAPSSSSFQPPQFGLDVFSALNESLRGASAGGSSSSRGSRQLKNQVRERAFGCFVRSSFFFLSSFDADEKEGR